MGANEKHAAAMHGGEHDFGSADPISANRVRFMSESELDRFITKIRAEAKAEALEEAADELDKSKQPARHGLPMMLRADWLRERANQIKEWK